MTPCALFAKRNLMEAIHDESFFTRSLSAGDVFGLSLKASLLHSILEVPFEAFLSTAITHYDPASVSMSVPHDKQKNAGKPDLTHAENLHQKTRRCLILDEGICSVINCVKYGSVGRDKVKLQ